MYLQIYEGKIDPWVMSDNCTDNVPILIKRATFCSAFAADARDFRQYNSWVRLCARCARRCQQPWSCHLCYKGNHSPSYTKRCP